MAMLRRAFCFQQPCWNENLVKSTRRPELSILVVNASIYLALLAAVSRHRLRVQPWYALPPWRKLCLNGSCGQRRILFARRSKA